MVNFGHGAVGADQVNNLADQCDIRIVWRRKLPEKAFCRCHLFGVTGGGSYSGFNLCACGPKGIGEAGGMIGIVTYRPLYKRVKCARFEFYAECLALPHEEANKFAGDNADNVRYIRLDNEMDRGMG